VGPMNPYQSPNAAFKAVERPAPAKRSVPWGVQVTGALHLVVFLVAGSFMPDKLSWRTYLIAGSVWLFLIIGSYDVVRGRRWGIHLLIAIHCLVFAATLALIGYAIKEIIDPTPMLDKRGLVDEVLSRDIAALVILPSALGFLSLSGLVLFWVVHLKRRYFR